MTEVQAKLGLSVSKKTNYLNTDYLYLRNVTISEWDIHAAGFSVLKYKKVLPEKELAELEAMDKHKRTVREGLLQKYNPEVAKLIISTLEDVRYQYVLQNSISYDSILSIKKDAFFLINKIPKKNTVFDIFEFRKKGTYTSYLQLNKKEFYYCAYNRTLETKGISKEYLENDNCQFLKDIQNFMSLAERANAIDLFRVFRDYRERYLNYELPLETYRELDTGSFRIGKYVMNDVKEKFKHDLDISQNYLNYFLPLIQNIL